MPDVNERYVATRSDDTTGDTEEELGPLGIAAVRRFAAAVSKQVDEQLTDEVVEARLAAVRREALARSGSGRIGERGYAQELARYGYTLVRIWLQVVRIGMNGAAALGRQSVGLDESEIHELAKDTTARAIAGFHDDQSVDLKTDFLTQCVRRLPDAYRSRQLELGRVAIEIEVEFGSRQAGAHLVRALRHCFGDRAAETAHLVRTWTDSDAERDEIMELTRRAVDRAIRLYPEIVRDGANEVARP